MAKKDSYREYLKKEFAELIDALELPDLEKRFMKSRCLDQLLWLEGRAEQAKKWSARLRLTTIVGGVLIPALVSLNFNDSKFGTYIGWGTFALSQMVAISAAVEEYFHFGDKYTQYRTTAESLKSEMWKFLQLSDFYHKYPNHGQAYSTFASRVEKTIQDDVQSFVELVQQSSKEEKELEQEQQEYFSSLSDSGSVPTTPNSSQDKTNNALKSEAVAGS